MKKDLVHAYMLRQDMLESDYEIYHYLDKTIRSVEVHHHDFYELYFFIEGEVEYYIEGKIYKLKAGDIVLINTRELHQAVIDNNAANYERIVLWMDKAFIESISTEISNITECFESKEKQTVVNTDLEIRTDIHYMFNKIIALEGFKGMGSDILGKAYIMELLVKINNIVKNKERVYSVDAKKSALIDGMIYYIENNISEPISIDTLSDKFFLSKYHLLREFKKYTGVTIHRYIVLKRLAIAKGLILKKESITEVCIKCGFRDYSNFFKAFKNEYGITPKQFYEIMTKRSEE